MTTSWRLCVHDNCHLLSCETCRHSHYITLRYNCHLTITRHVTWPIAAAVDVCGGGGADPLLAGGAHLPRPPPLLLTGRGHLRTQQCACGRGLDGPVQGSVLCSELAVLWRHLTVNRQAHGTCGLCGTMKPQLQTRYLAIEGPCWLLKYKLFALRQLHLLSCLVISFQCTC